MSIDHVIQTTIPLLVAILGAIVPILRTLRDKDDKAKLHAATKAAYLIAAEVSKRTSTKIDDGIALVLRLAEQEFEASRGRKLTSGEAREVQLKAITMSADPKMPGSLGELDDETIAKLAPHFLAPQAKQRVEP